MNNLYFHFILGNALIASSSSSAIAIVQHYKPPFASYGHSTISLDIGFVPYEELHLFL